MLATTHPATELVELGQPKTIGAFDHHGGSVGDVDTHFDDGSRHQNIEFVVAEGQHHGVFVFGTHFAVNQGHPQVREDLGLQLDVHFFGRGQV